MPRLFNVENCLFQTVALASLSCAASQTATFTGLTTNDGDSADESGLSNRSTGGVGEP